MRKIGFIGAYDKTDLILYLARILSASGKKILFIDSTITQKAKYVVPEISPVKSYVTNFENIDVAVGFEDYYGIKEYLGMPSHADMGYDYAFLDIDDAQKLENFQIDPGDVNYFVTSFDLYSLKRGLEVLGNLKEKLKQNHTELLEVEQEKIQKAKIEARNIILEAKEEANEIIRKMKEIEKEADIDANKKLNNLRNKLNEDIKEQNQELNTKTQNIDTKKEQVKPGITVYVENLGQQGTVISNVSKDEQVLVQIGSLKMKVQIQNLRIIKDIEPKKQNNISQNYTKIDKTRNAKTEINVIGMNVEEARFVVEKFLDDSILAHLQTVRIVHGKGTGKTLEDLEKLKHVLINSRRR